MVPRAVNVAPVVGDQQLLRAPDLGEGLLHTRERPHVPEEVGLPDALSVHEAVLHAADALVRLVAPGLRRAPAPAGLLLKQIPQELLTAGQVRGASYVRQDGEPLAVQVLQPALVLELEPWRWSDVQSGQLLLLRWRRPSCCSLGRLPLGALAQVLRNLPLNRAGQLHEHISRLLKAPSKACGRSCNGHGQRRPEGKAHRQMPSPDRMQHHGEEGYCQ
mmetsp:Transcript_38888/g.121013  ORF Transcript_38888/g.121013 Transcript_38888/m.121013 type:complete len:218 (-) Transcript_38888:67-720(-)